jgi:hypothetical protein
LTAPETSAAKAAKVEAARMAAASISFFMG